MKCENFMQNYLEMDNFQHVSLTMRIHLYFCSRCRSEVRGLETVFRNMNEFVPCTVESAFSARLMRKLARIPNGYKKEISFYNWIGVGMLIFSSAFLIAFSDSLTWLKVQFGSNLEVPLAMVLGASITVYAAIFIGSHMDKFGDLLRKINRYI